MSWQICIVGVSRFIANATLDKLKDIGYFVPVYFVLQNDSTVNVDSLLGRYSFAATAGKLKSNGEIALWRQKWIRLKNESNFFPETAVAALEACDHTTFPLIHTCQYLSHCQC